MNKIEFDDHSFGFLEPQDFDTLKSVCLRCILILDPDLSFSLSPDRLPVSVRYHLQQCATLQDRISLAEPSLSFQEMTLTGDCSFLPLVALQFAHEWMHHLFLGPVPLHIQGCHWLEETLCETASQYCLSLMGAYKAGIPSDYSTWHPEYASFLLAYMARFRDTYVDLFHNGRLESLIRNPYDVDGTYLEYSALAQRLLPIFLQTPGLFGAFASLRHLATYSTLQEVFQDLESHNDGSLRDALSQIRQILMSPRS